MCLVKQQFFKTRMHSSRVRTTRSLTVSPYSIVFARGCVWHVPSTTHAPHCACPLPCMPPCHTCPLPHMPPCHTCPLCHACPPATHAPLPCMPPTMHALCHAWPPCHAHSPCGQTDTCKNITFANFVCRW